MTMNIWGEVLSWSCTSVSVVYRVVLEALTTAGLDPASAGEMKPRNAFTRACRKLDKQRVIRVVHETAAVAQFQFTRERPRGGRYDYELEAILSLDKSTGKVSGEVLELAAQAQEELDKAIINRTGHDITLIVQRLFKAQADLFPLRDRGGVYFVPERHLPFVAQVETFLSQLGGKLQRLPVQMGSPSGDRCVKETVMDGIASLIRAHKDAIAELDTDTRPSTFKKVAERIQISRLKAEGYAEYLGDGREKLLKELDQAKAELGRRIDQIAAEKVTAPELPLAEPVPA